MSHDHESRIRALEDAIAQQVAGAVAVHGGAMDGPRRVEVPRRGRAKPAGNYTHVLSALADAFTPVLDAEYRRGLLDVSEHIEALAAKGGAR
jgi:hypothetical protein